MAGTQGDEGVEADVQKEQKYQACITIFKRIPTEYFFFQESVHFSQRAWLAMGTVSSWQENLTVRTVVKNSYLTIEMWHLLDGRVSVEYRKGPLDQIVCHRAKIVQ